MTDKALSALVPVIMCGGSGTRLWPLSRDQHPKQLLPLASERSLLQDTAVRAASVAPGRAPIVVCNEDHRFMVAEQMRALEQRPGAIILEPAGRNTAPAIAVAAHDALQREGEGALLLVLAADHVIPGADAFAEAVKTAAACAMDGRCVTFGIVPTHAETGFGYLHAEEGIGTSRKVLEFVEKPDAATAATYVASGNHFWNSGMFVFGARHYLELLSRFAPEIAECAQRAYTLSERDMDFTRLDAAAFEACPSDSVDYAVMERAEDVAMVALDAGWNDVGSWSALWDLADRDTSGNALLGDVIATDTQDSYVRAEKRLVATVGMRNVVVIETADAVLVADRNRVQGVKEIVSRLKAQGRSEQVSHREVFRPWGSHESLAEHDGYQVKRVRLLPGRSQTLQRHLHRAEHWIVVKGNARVTRGDETLSLSANESTYIQPGVEHRIENNGHVTLEMIEVRTGPYLGEDDIERLS